MFELLDSTRKSSSRPRRFSDLILIDNWVGSLAVIVAGLVVSFLLFGFWWPYWRIADMDFWMVYEAWLLNDGLAQEWFDHPGYLTILLLGWWFRALHALGLLSAHAFSLVPAAGPEAHQAWTAATRAARVYTLALATGYLLAFSVLIRRLTGDWRIAILAAFVLTFSSGLAGNARIIRTELIAGGAVTIALLLLIVAARSPASNWRPALAGLAALLATLGLINKIQVIYLICALPILVFPFGVVSAGTANVWRASPRAIAATLALCACAVLAAIPAAEIVSIGLLGASKVPLWTPFLLNTYGAYQALIGLWIAAGIVAFAVWWRVPLLETVAVALCVVIGIALALLTLELRYNPQNVVVVVNPLEQLFYWARASNPEIGGLLGLIKDLLHGLYVVFSTRTFVLQTSARPTIFLEWLVIAGSIVAWRAGHRTLVVQIALLMLAVWGMDAISAIRGLKQQYFILTDPLVVVAAALLLAGYPTLQAHRRAYAIGMTLLVLHVTFSHAELVKDTVKTSKPMAFCTPHFGYTKRVVLFPYCQGS